MKKAGVVTAGVVAALVAASPMAWAHGTSGDVCTFTGGDAAATSSIVGESGSNIVNQDPSGGDIDDNDDNCATYGNDSENGNESGNVLTELLGVLD